MSEERVTPSRLRKKKSDRQKITMLTAYDCPMAKFINEAGVDIVLVSDALGTVGLGRAEAVSVSVNEMIYHTNAVRNGAGSSMVATTLPFGSYETVEQALESAIRIMKEGHADGVHFEGTASDSPKAKAIVDAGIPVMGHVGVIKQKIVRSGTIRVEGRTARSAAHVVADSLAFANAGVFALILECVPSRVGEIVTRSLDIPTIGIGAGPYCDGQALVTQDMLGLFKGLSPRFLKVYLDLSNIIVGALTEFRTEVERGGFPTTAQSYTMSEDELSQLAAQLKTMPGESLERKATMR